MKNSFIGKLATGMFVALFVCAATVYAGSPIIDGTHKDFLGDWQRADIPTGMDGNGLPEVFRISLNPAGETVVLVAGLQTSVATKTVDKSGAPTLRGNLSNGTNYIFTMDPYRGLVYDLWENNSWHRLYYFRQPMSLTLLNELVGAKAISGAMLIDDRDLMIDISGQRRWISSGSDQLSAYLDILQRAGVPLAMN